MQEDVGADGVAGELPGFQRHHLELRLGFGAGLGLGGPVHLHAAEERGDAGGLGGRDVEKGELQGRGRHRLHEGARADEGLLFRDFGMMHLAGDLFQIYDALIISFFRQGESKSEVCYFLEVGIRGAASDFG